MKNYILFALVALSFTSCISVKVNHEDGLNKVYSTYINPNLSAQGTYFENGVKDSEWSNQNSPNTTQAKFKKANGISYIKLMAKKNMKVEFHHQLKVEGRMRFEILDAKETVIFERDLSQNREEHFDLKLQEGEYIVRWNAHDANGSYFLEWKEK